MFDVFGGLGRFLGFEKQTIKKEKDIIGRPEMKTKTTYSILVGKDPKKIIPTN